MIDRIDSEIGFQRTALNMRSYRQELLASNIANADTPNYKARDIDFKSALSAALSGKSEGPVAMAQTHAGHLPGLVEANPFGSALRYRSEYQGAVDGNTVNMDIERAAFAENALQTEATLAFISGRFKSLASAIQGQ